MSITGKMPTGDTGMREVLTCSDVCDGSVPVNAIVERIAVLPASEGPTRRSAVPLDLDFLRENAIAISKPMTSAKESSNKLWGERPSVNGTTSGVTDIVSSLGESTPMLYSTSWKMYK
jgi:hypothetical protein